MTSAVHILRKGEQEKSRKLYTRDVSSGFVCFTFGLVSIIHRFIFFAPQQPLHLRNSWAPRELSYSGVLREMKNKWILFFKENFVARKSVKVLIIIKLIRLGECFAFQDFQV
jgi:hypothetical protein